MPLWLVSDHCGCLENIFWTNSSHVVAKHDYNKTYESNSIPTLQYHYLLRNQRQRRIVTHAQGVASIWQQSQGLYFNLTSALSTTQIHLLQGYELLGLGWELWYFGVPVTPDFCWTSLWCGVIVSMAIEGWSVSSCFTDGDHHGNWSLSGWIMKALLFKGVWCHLGIEHSR